MKFIIVDDSEYYRKQLTTQVNAINGYEVVAAAQSGQELLSLIPSIKPAVVLADINLPDMNVMDAAEKIIQNYPNTHFLCITQSNIAEWIYQMRQIGIKGYLYKTCEPANIQKAVSSALLNQFYVDKEIINSLVKEVRKFISKSDLSKLNELNNISEDGHLDKSNKSLTQKIEEYNQGTVEFTNRELDILSATRNGVKVTEIAKQLGISTRYISTIKENLREKLDVKSNPELVPEALKKGLIS